MSNSLDFTSWNLGPTPTTGIAGAQHASPTPLDETLTDLILAAAHQHPDHVALQLGNTTLTYRQLVDRAQAVAAWLRSRGVDAEDRVCIIADRQAGVYPAVLGVLMARAAYVPLDHTAPAARLHSIIARCGAKVIVTDAETWTRVEQPGIVGLLIDQPLPFQTIAVQRGLLALISSLAPADPAELPQPTPNDLAYVIFTSGSTGVPKGVMVEHRSVANLVRWVGTTMDINGSSRVTQNASLFFDASVQQIFPAWSAGATLVPVPERDRVDGARLLTWLREQRITHWDSIPTLWSRVVAAAPQPIAAGEPWLPDLKAILLAGEPLSAADVTRWRSWEQGHRLFNIYGPTEATVDATFHEISTLPEGGIVPIGKPLPGVVCHVLDAHGQPCPPHVDGELYLEGVCLARGYLDDTDETQRSFTMRSLGPHSAVRVYRTGDIVRRLPSDDLVYVGRRDEQMKVNGVRIEPAEVEHALRQHPSVQEAVVVAVPRNTQQGYDLVALAHSRSQVRVDDLRGFVAELLTPSMIPSRIVMVDTIPQTANGKIDRRACIEIAQMADEQAGSEQVGPQNAVETTLLQLCQKLLGQDIGVDDDLFRVGADSITIIRLRHACAEAGLPVRAADIFTHSSVRKLAQFVADNRTRLEAQARDDRSDAGWSGISEAATDQFPLLPSQRALLAATLLHDSAQVQVGLVQEIHEYAAALDPRLLEATLEVLVERHDALRVGVMMPDSGNPYQWVAEATQVSFATEDAAALEAAAQDEVVRTIAERELHKGFDLQHPPLLGLVAVQQGAARTTLVWTMHHIVTDGWSWELLQREFAQIYEAVAAGKFRPLPPAPSFRQFVQHLAAAPPDERIEPIVTMLSNATVVRLPRPASKVVERVRAVDGWQVPPEIHLALFNLAAQAGVTVGTVYLYTAGAVLSRILRERQLVLGLVSSGRNVDVAGVERLVGSLARTVPIVLETEPGTPSHAALQQLQSRVHSVMALDGNDIQDLLARKAVPLDIRAPEVTFIFQNYDSGIEATGLAGSKLQPQVDKASWLETAASPLSIVIHSSLVDEGAMELRIEYWPSRVEREFVVTLIRETARVLRRMGA